ncbi:AraC-type DNA-binding protein [Pseudomonas cuatrocienegasensis]|uniref:AraC-type DNA-binding protein n=1 Tax=Pseudomonas cuatrocienegasensis TaxID=543360 RepID=A0ABY1BRI7_9PSED|nr:MULTISPECIES: AraC family transcriptional regulator [Pseudomonas]OEC32674.1 regulator [Pseudomonas sp. 21C1]SER46028.1 AraC-type DNA-binding protein [Pseudomonas cuatrocienegasensis]
MDWRQARSCSGVRYLLETAKDNHLAVEPCLLGSAIDSAQLARSDSTIEAWQELAVIRNLIQRIGRPGLGFSAGRQYHLTTLGLLGFTMLASETLASALAALDRFQSLALAICPVKTLAEPRGLWVIFDDSVVPRDARVFVVERGLSAVVQIVSELMQRPLVPLAIEVRYACPTEGLAGYLALACPVSFASNKNGVLFAAADLACALPQANHTAHHQGEVLCGRLIEEAELASGALPITRRVQRVLLEHAASLLTARAVASLMGMSDRTLHRRLADEGQRFRSLNDQIKARFAQRLLSESRMDLQQVAQCIGYSDAASFCRAFQRWTGQSPGHWKRLS